MKKGDNNREIIRALALFTQLGLSMASCVFLGVLAGKFLDSKLGTAPWLLLICSLIGACAAFKVLYDLAIKRWNKK